MTATLGNTSNVGQLDTEDVGHVNAFLVSAPVAGDISSISVYVGPIAAGAQFQVAIYSDLNGKPGSSVATSAEQALTANAWNTAPITYSFTAGQPIWLCYNASGTSKTLNNLTLGPPGTFYWTVAAFGSWPVFGTPEGGSSEMAAIYATYTTTSVALVVIDTFNGHTVYGDANQGNKVIPWQSFYLVASTAVSWLVNQCPLDPATKLPAYYSQAYLNPGDPPTVSDYWQCNPAGLLSMLIDSGTAWSSFSGDATLLMLAVSLANYHLAHGLTPSTDKWPSVPYAGSTQGQATYNGLEKTNAGVEVLGVIEPDKVGEAGWQLANLYSTTKNLAYLNAAINNANALVANIRPSTSSSPWPFRAYASNGNVIADYSSDVIRPIQLFDALIALNVGNVASYQATRTKAWNWLMSGPVANNQWYNYFEDIPDGTANINNYVPLETARYLLLNPNSDPNSLAKAQAIVTFVESALGSSQWGASIMTEQQAYNFAMGSHTSRYGSVLALIAKATGDATLKEKAYRALSWATYEENADGQVVAFIASGQPTQIWFSDGYGDYVRHFVSAMNTFPEWRK
jgi:hypothetical protein